MDYISRSKLYEFVKDQGMQHWKAAEELKVGNPAASEMEARIGAAFFALAGAIRDS